MSEQVPVYIKEVALVDFKGFRGEHKFSFVDENGEWCRWTVFLGNNNTGKTNLLTAIASLEPKEDNGNGAENSFFPLGESYNVFNEESIYGAVFGIDVHPIVQKVELNDKYKIFIKNQNYNLVYSNTSSQSYTRGQNDKIFNDLSIYGYGVIRDIEKKGISTVKNFTLNAENLFNNSKLLNFEDWLFQLDYAAKNKQEKAAQRRDLLTTVLTSEIFPELNDIRFISDKNLNNYIEFQTKDGWHKLSELGYGYQATLSWMVDFCKKLFDRYPESENPLKEPAVLLVDEIDLHLHPQWQRTIIKYLSDIFTATQFIVTTHSPFILQSMENVNLYTLQREGDHTIVSHLGNHSYIGWKIEEILSEVMGLEDNVNTDQYNALISMFDKALDADDYNQGKEAYEQLMKILHPQSAERKLLDIQFSQLTPDDDKA